VTTVTAASRTPVSETIDEGALELEIPVVKDLSIVRSAALNGAVRYAAYDSAGNTMPGESNITNRFSAVTWKAGLDVHLDEGVTLRATRSRDFRAPTLIDLYQPASVALAVFKDDLTGNAPQVPMSTSGNPYLKPEVSYTTTGGVIWQPIQQFSLSADYFNINISDAILSVNGAQDNIQDACYASGGSSFYCSLQSRPSGYTNTSSANVVTEWFVQPLNIAELRTWGADFESDFRTTVLARPLSLRAFATFQPHLVYEQPGVATYDQAGVDFNNSGVQSTPVWHMLGTVDYVPIDPLTITWQTTWRSELHHPFSTTEAYAPGYMFVPPVSYTNLNLSYRIKVRALAELEVYLNIQDLFNQQPPLTSFSGTSAVPGQAGNGFTIGDDPIGRYFTLGVRGKF
jgi:iron complex outermembrane receptor protein